MWLHTATFGGCKIEVCFTIGMPKVSPDDVLNSATTLDSNDSDESDPHGLALSSAEPAA